MGKIILNTNNDKTKMYSVTTESKTNNLLKKLIKESKDLSNSYFYECEISDIDFSDLFLNNSTFIRCTIKDCIFNGATMRHFSFKYGYMSNCEIKRAILTGAIFENTKVENCDFFDTWLASSLMYRSKFSNCNFDEADFYKADLFSSDFKNCSFNSAFLNNSCLTFNIFYENKFNMTNITEATLFANNIYLSNAEKIKIACSFLRNNAINDDFIKQSEWEYSNFADNLYILKTLPKNTKIKAWKYLVNGESPYQNAEYKVGKTYKESNYDINEFKDCSKGLNVATLWWCLFNSSLEKISHTDEITFIEVEFQVKDIIAIPYQSDGKFRVKKFKVLREINEEQAIKELKEIVKL